MIFNASMIQQIN